MDGRDGPEAERAGITFGCYLWGSGGQGHNSTGGLGQGVPQEIDKTLLFALGNPKKKATLLTDADHVGLPRAVCSMVSSVGSRWH